MGYHAGTVSPPNPDRTMQHKYTPGTQPKTIERPQKYRNRWHTTNDLSHPSQSMLIPFHLNLSHPNPSHPIPFHPIPSHSIPSRLTRPKRGGNLATVSPFATVNQYYHTDALSSPNPKRKFQRTKIHAWDATKKPERPQNVSKPPTCNERPVTPSDPTLLPAIPSHLVPSHRVPLIPSHFIPSHPIPSHPIPSHPIPSHPIPSHPIPSHPT